MREQLTAHVEGVVGEAGAWVLQVQHGEEAIGLELTAEVHVHISAIAIHPIQQILEKVKLSWIRRTKRPLT